MERQGDIIEVEHLSKRFAHERTIRDIVRGKPADETWAVRDLTFSVCRSEVFGLVGPNGAGKTTLLRLLSTLLVPTSGTARINGADISLHGAAVRAQIGLVTSNERSFFWRLSGRQNLLFFCDLYRIPGKEARRWTAELLDMLDLTDVADQRFDSYSTGIKQRMAIARGLLSRPQVLFMDEPTKGVDPTSSQGLIRLIRERVVSRWKQTVIITTHNLREIEQLCDRTMIMDHGRMAYLGTVKALKHSVSREETYRLVVTGVPAAAIAQMDLITGMLGPVHFHAGPAGYALEARMREGSGAFAALLECIHAHGGRVESCRCVELPIEDAFVKFIEKIGAARAHATEAVQC
ncbi:MAG TPA: ABC transporter ATP-binding protein [Burkholderiales bacterium]|nr:ABC transporter ATP-binding protein [Burkholderiales bacterium]